MKKQIKELIEESNSILLLTHENPDGDAIGSVLGIYYYLISINKSVDMVVLDIPKVFNFMPSINKIVDTVDKSYDLGIVVDCSSRERIGQNDDLFSRCKKTICIDHHISNSSYCDVNYVFGDVCSCCQVIYYLFKDLNIEITNEIGFSLCTGVITDTNGFSIDSVNSDTFNMMADLINIGIDVHMIYHKTLNMKTMSQYNLMKIGMSRLEFFDDGKIAFTYILKDDFDKVSASLGEHEGIVDIGRNIEGVEVSIFVREDDGFNVSLRSNGKVDVGYVASLLGGGGHRMASGAKIKMSLEETKRILISEIEKVL